MTPAPAAPPGPGGYPWAAQPLFAPIAGLLARFPDGLPDAARLTATLREVAPDAACGAGLPIGFILPPAGLQAYEVHIHATGEVPTRADDWHDFFNALAWCVWPRAKAACNARHLEVLREREAAGLSGRGPLRDALTQFDECGVLVVSSDPQIPELLAAHEWLEVFWTRRARLMATTRFLVFGHASWDQLRAPFIGLCAKALYRVVPPGWFAQAAALRQADADAWLAARLADGLHPLGRESLFPLPLLGIPGVTPDNECAAYYTDTRQFRPLRRTGGGLG
ncbi:DUF3025 domain-containing protein [Zoogloea sp.]|uniref:DUF3025 domain-containing protein n=1 Tax=Zoogloea sp. TaxID=49181 RepID=UPI0014166FFB|nr:MAG: DUF3025 domain-containing protein [Zoogloea sp.]